MQPDLNSQLYDAIFRQDIEAISTLIQQDAELDPSLISSTGLDDAAQAQFDKDKIKLLESFYALFNKTLGSDDAKNPLVDFAEQSDALAPQLTDESQVFLDRLRNCCQAAMLPKLNAWQEALREYSALEGNPKHDHRTPLVRYVADEDGGDPKPVYDNNEKMMMLRFAHRFITHNRFIAPQKICQEILNFILRILIAQTG